MVTGATGGSSVRRRAAPAARRQLPPRLADSGRGRRVANAHPPYVAGSQWFRSSLLLESFILPGVWIQAESTGGVDDPRPGGVVHRDSVSLALTGRAELRLSG